MNDGRKEEISKQFGKNLKRIRIEKDLSLRQLAAGAELEHAQIARIEDGLIQPTLATIVFLAEALGVDPKDLLP